MVCQQLLFTETSVVPDSWWLTNLQWRTVLASDLMKAVADGFIAPALAEDYADCGLYGRYQEQLGLAGHRRLAGLLSGNEQESFLRSVDQTAAFVSYDSAQLRKFFSNMVRLLSDSPIALSSFGLDHVQAEIKRVVREKVVAGEGVTATDLFNLFGDNSVLRDRAMSMFRPIYVINAPLNYGYHLALAGDEKDRLYGAVLTLLRDIALSMPTYQLFMMDDIESLCTPLNIDDPVFRDAGVLTYEEIAGARSLYFRKLKEAFIAFCEGGIGQITLENAFKNYQSDIRDYLAQRNNRFDVILAKGIRTAATMAGYAGKAASSVGTTASIIHGYPPLPSFLVGLSVGVLAHFIQRCLEEAAIVSQKAASSAGHQKLFTRLDVWMGNRQAMEQGRFLD